MKLQQAEENCIMRSFIVLFSKYNENDEVKEDGMGRACSTNGVKRMHICY
jgi:hypothetical protein